MSSWRDIILNDFVLGVSKLTLVADPDSLLTEEKLALELRQRGFDLIEFNDPIEFRYAFESKYRAIWDSGKQTDLVVILHLQDNKLDSLPYDLLQTGRKLSFNLGDLFPNMSYPVIEALDRSLLDDLFEAQRKSPPDRMGDNASKDYILRHVFSIAAELITNEVEVLSRLLCLHYGKALLPQVLSDRLVYLLKQHGTFETWPLEQIIPNDEAFFAFLQERWPIFLSRHGKTGQLREVTPEYNLKYSGPEDLSFDHHDIRVYVDNLFVEGKLTPVQVADLSFNVEPWIRCGIIEANHGDVDVRLSRLFTLLEKEIPTTVSRYTDWTVYALKWAELSALVHCKDSDSYRERLHGIGDRLNAIFVEWLDAHYASLINLPPTIPAMLHHVPQRLARDLERSNDSRVALIVVDGLALDQWVTVRQVLQEQDRNLLIRESATFAWVPTLTSVARQAIFSGKPPLYFPSSINSTNSESILWKKFWTGHGYSQLDIAYQRGLSGGNAASILEAIIHPGKTKAIGLVVDKVDKIMHGMQLGAAGMHNQIRQWCQGGFLSSLIGNLLDYEYEVWMTSDHGNIECQGKGRPAEGVIAETRGERVRVYPTPELRSQTAKAFAFAHNWQPIGLPSGYFPLVASGNDAFINIGDSVVSHGGIAIEEVIVPLVKFERKQQ
jgi:hypothetical protein